jgi:hypothetical protein
VRSFDSFAQQRNYAQREIPFRHPWVLHLDADERIPVQVRIECGGVIGFSEVDGFFAASKVLWHGKWVRHSSRCPQPQIRFVRAPEFQFVDGPQQSNSFQRTCAWMNCSPRRSMMRRRAAKGPANDIDHAVAAARHHMENRRDRRAMLPPTRRAGSWRGAASPTRSPFARSHLPAPPSFCRGFLMARRVSYRRKARLLRRNDAAELRWP